MNGSNVLVTFGTKNGSTASIAVIIAATLTEAVLRTEVRPAGEVRSVTGYDAVVLGGALYNYGRQPMRRAHSARGNMSPSAAG